MCIEIPWNVALVLVLFYGLLVYLWGIICWIRGYSRGCSNRTRLEFNQELKHQLTLMGAPK